VKCHSVSARLHSAKSRKTAIFVLITVRTRSVTKNIFYFHFVCGFPCIFRPRGPLGWLDPGAFGTLGVGGGFALGAKLCQPDAEVWILYGDGSCGFSVAEIDTMTRHKVPVIALVGNDAAWTQIAREQVPMFGSSVGCKLAVSICSIVDGVGSCDSAVCTVQLIPYTSENNLCLLYRVITYGRK
jgi:hypothetical protein